MLRLVARLWRCILRPVTRKAERRTGKARLPQIGQQLITLPPKEIECLRLVNGKMDMQAVLCLRHLEPKGAKVIRAKRQRNWAIRGCLDETQNFGRQRYLGGGRASWCWIILLWAKTSLCCNRDQDGGSRIVILWMNPDFCDIRDEILPVGRDGAICQAGVIHCGRSLLHD